jgi:hypothetical protein
VPRVAVALLLTLVVLPFSASAAGHDVSAVRFAPSDLYIRSTRIAANGSRFLTVWAMDNVYPRPNLAYGAVREAANGPSSMPFLLPGVSGFPTAMMPWGGGFISLWSHGDGFDIITFFANGGVQRVSHVQRNAQPPRFATNGHQLLVVDIQQVTEFYYSHNVAYASLYDPAGNLLARTSLPAARVTNFDVARVGDSYVVVTGADSGEVRFFRIDDEGTIIAERELQGVPPPYAIRTPAVAVAGDAEHAVVAWTPTDTSTAHVTSVSSSNEVAALQPLPLDYGAYGGNPGIRIVPTTSGFLIIGNEGRRVSVVRTTAAGRIIDSDAIPIASEFLLNDATAAGDQFAAIVSPDRYPYTSPLSTVIGTVLPQGVSASTSPLVTLTAARQEQSVIASDGVDYVAAWLEHNGSDVIAMVGRVTRAGVPLDGAGIALPVPSKEIASVSITRGAGGDALVLVSAGAGTSAFRWSRAAGLVDTAPIILDPNVSEFGTAVAWNGVSYLAVWVNAYPYTLVGRFIGSDGTAGAKFSIPMTLFKDEWVEARSPAIAWDGRQFLISIPTAYGIPCSSLCTSPPAEEIRLVCVSPTGSLLDKSPYRVLKANSARIATSGREFLLLSSDYYSFSTAIVHADASGLSVTAPIMTTQDARASDVTWDGASYDVAWTGIGGFLRLWRLDRTGHVQQKFFVTGPDGTPSVIANDAGEVAIGLAESAPPSNLPRARIYFDAELQPVPPALPTPTNATGHLTPRNEALLHWDGDAPGYLVEWLFRDIWHELQHVPSNVHEATVYANSGDTFRIRAYGPDGSSPEGAIVTVQSGSRTRAVRR